MFGSALSYLLLFVSSGLAQKKLVCYFFHDGPVSNIEPNLCTHVHYYSLTLDSNTLLMRFQDDAEIKTTVKDVFKLKAKNGKLKIVATLGGGYDDGGNNLYGKMVATETTRANFVKNAVTFLNQYKFDGLDFDWEYPACPYTDCNEEHKPEKDQFASLLREIRVAFDANSRKLSLSVCVNAGAWLTDNAFDYPTMASSVDYINVLTYDNAGSWMQVTGHNGGMGWVIKGMKFWTSTGVPKRKLLLGVNLYGITFTLADPTQHKIGAPATSADEHLLYNEICLRVKSSNWTKVRTGNGLYAYNGNEWVSYNDPMGAAKKAKWVKDSDYGGVFVWEISQDDITGKCCSTLKPMMKAIAFGLFGNGSKPSTYGCPPITPTKKSS